MISGGVSQRNCEVLAQVLQKACLEQVLAELQADRSAEHLMNLELLQRLGADRFQVYQAIT